MNINPKILSIPPYISTSWKNIASLHVDNRYVLIVTLLNGARIEVPNLEGSILEEIFKAHSRYLEQEEKALTSKMPPRNQINLPISPDQVVSFDIPMKNGLAEIEGLGALLQHDPEQAGASDLPQDVLSKITQLSKSMGIDDPHAFPRPEPDCNCMRCQIARAMQAGIGADGEAKEDQEEIVSDAELQFRTWDVAQKGDKLYQVTNPLDDKEHYNVFLGDPIGCTCGHHHCEHIQAVLKT